MLCYNLLLCGVSWGMEVLITDTPMHSTSTELSDQSLPAATDDSPAHQAQRCATVLNQFVDGQIDDQTLQQCLVIVNTDVCIRDDSQPEAAPEVVSRDQRRQSSHEGSVVAEVTKHWYHTAS